MQRNKAAFISPFETVEMLHQERNGNNANAWGMSYRSHPHDLHLRFAARSGCFPAAPGGAGKIT